MMTTMVQVERIKTEIESLPRQAFIELRDWLLERDWEKWDRQIEVDSASGKLDFLLEEAMAAKKDGTLKEI